MQWVAAAQTDVHQADLVEVLPVLHLGRIAIEFGQVPAQKHLAVLDLRAVFGHPLVWVGLASAVSL